MWFLFFRLKPPDCLLTLYLLKEVKFPSFEINNSAPTVQYLLNENITYMQKHRYAFRR